MKTEENISLTEESKKQDKQDHFSDIEDSNDSFQVNVNFIKIKQQHQILILILK